MGSVNCITDFNYHSLRILHSDFRGKYLIATLCLVSSNILLPYCMVILANSKVEDINMYADGEMSATFVNKAEGQS